MAEVKINRDDFPSNSRKANTTKEEAPKKEKVISGSVIKKEKTLGHKFKDAFFNSESTANIKDYIFLEVIVPTIRDAISDAIKGSADMIFGGGKPTNRNSRRNNDVSHFSYSSISKDAKSKTNYRSRNKARLDFDDIIIDNYGEAVQVIDLLVEHTFRFGEVTVADLYDLVGISSDYPDRKYGWTDLSSAQPRRVRGGYLLDLPRAKLLD